MDFKRMWQALVERMKGREAQVPKAGIVFIGDRITVGGEPASFETLDVDGRKHMMLLGSTARGRSSHLQAEAIRLGISYDELVKQLEPTEEQKRAAREREEAESQRDLARLNAVREAYWSATAAESSDLYVFDDALSQIDGMASPSPEQQKALFFMLPAYVVGLGISWGFSDTEVRGAIWEFVEEHKAEVAAAVAGK